jgi:hypothetical protein
VKAPGVLAVFYIDPLAPVLLLASYNACQQLWSGGVKEVESVSADACRNDATLWQMHRPSGDVQQDRNNQRSPDGMVGPLSRARLSTNPSRTGTVVASCCALAEVG